MARTDEEFGVGRQRESMIDSRGVIYPSTIGDQLRNDGYRRTNMPVGNHGQVTIPPRYPLAGNAGFDSDNDADDYNTAALYGENQSTSSSSGP